MSSPTLDRVLDAVLRVDGKLDILFVSEPGQRWFTQIPGAQIPKNFAEVVHPEDVAGFRQALAGTAETFSRDLRILKGGTECWINLRCYPLSGVGQHVFCIFDISRWKTEDFALRRAAENDELTGLPNRAFLKKTVDEYIQEGKGPFSIALLDLDGFKKVNDTYGHAMGDAVLVETTKRLVKLIGPGDMMARLGGDEFVLLYGGKNAEAAKLALKNVLLAVARPYDTAPHNAYLGVSIGVAEYPLHGEDYSTLLKNADTAMYFSKNAGKNRVTVFAATEANVDFSIRAAIHNGIQEGEFYMEYQPQYDMQNNLVGAEALMRWVNRDLGRVNPDQFIPIVEDSGLMPFLGKWALRYSCYQLKKFHALDPDFVMSVNVSPVQFGSDNFDEQVLEVIRESGIDPSRLVLEITESTLMSSQQKTERALARLREHGIRFSIDDFGTGFSSLSYLTRLPVSSIKIDKAFVTAMGEDGSEAISDRKLITAMINLAHSIDLKVVAEGVETNAQFAFLKAAGCNLVQGYLTGRPQSAEALSRLLQPQAAVA
ncbi:GGDEF domain-containing protein [Rhodoferax sp. GW822-FHT02A01]|uniref:GGDEF domain-containing protein n=1 Tax=Rhodoferax sp. GW822-FHT02A01 TaxID=3141537 RepID=UPI00315C63D4